MFFVFYFIVHILLYIQYNLCAVLSIHFATPVVLCLVLRTNFLTICSLRPCQFNLMCFVWSKHDVGQVEDVQAMVAYSKWYTHTHERTTARLPTKIKTEEEWGISVDHIVAIVVSHSVDTDFGCCCVCVCVLRCIPFHALSPYCLPQRVVISNYMWHFAFCFATRLVSIFLLFFFFLVFLFHFIISFYSIFLFFCSVWVFCSEWLQH